MQPTGGEPHVGCRFARIFVHSNPMTYDTRSGAACSTTLCGLMPTIQRSLLFGTFHSILPTPARPFQGDNSEGYCDISMTAFRWHIYQLVAGGAPLPMTWPGPKQAPPPLPDCSSDASCKASCSGYASCPSDGEWYCCADMLHCTGQHLCSGTTQSTRARTLGSSRFAGTPGLQYCSCGPQDGNSSSVNGVS